MKQGKLEAHIDKKPPLDEINFNQRTLELELRSKLADVESQKIKECTKGTLQPLPLFQGEYETKLEAKRIPSQRHHPPTILDVGNLTKLLSAPIWCTLPLAEL